MDIIFTSELSAIGSRSIIRIPLSASEQLPSGGMVIVQGTINGVVFQACYRDFLGVG